MHSGPPVRKSILQCFFLLALAKKKTSWVVFYGRHREEKESKLISLE